MSTALEPPPPSSRRFRPEHALLVLAYGLLCGLYVWQASRRDVPSIFSDELEMAQLSRAIAETGEPARRGVPLGFTTLVPWLTAPFWWIDSVASAFAAIKAFQVVVMAATIFPAYAIARFVVTPRWAVFAAAGAIAAPALVYAPFLVTEPFAYPAAALALYFIMRAATRPSPRSVILGVVACAVGSATKSELGVLFLVLAAVLGRRAWDSPWIEQRRARLGPSAPLVGLGLAAATIAAGWFALAAVSSEWELASHDLEGFSHSLVWAVGALALGLGVIPFVAALAVVLSPRRLAGRNTTSFRWVLGSAAVAMLWYTGVKGPSLGRVGLGGLVLERNLIYLTPLLLTALALVLERRRVPVPQLLAAGVVAYFLIQATPGRNFPYYEAHGLSIIAFADRIFHWSPDQIELALRIVPGATTALLLAAVVLGRYRRRTATVLVSALAALTLTWSLTTQIYGAHGEDLFANALAAGTAKPYNWVDQAVGGGTVAVLSQQVRDPNGIYLMEFWNRSIEKVWSVDGSAPGPGPTQTPDLADPDGTLTPSPGTDFVLTTNGVSVQGRRVLELGSSVLVALDGGPLKLSENQFKVDTDGWTGSEAAYNRFGVERDGAGFARVTMGRNFCVTVPLPSTVRVRFGSIAIGPDKQPAIGELLEERTLEVRPCTQRTLLFRPPAGPWRIEIEAETFVPAEVDSNLTERRALGVQVSFGFQPLGG